jgi:DNA polymerase III alpha subunit
VRIGLDKVKVLSYRSAFLLPGERVSHGPFGDLPDLLEGVRLSLRELAALVLSGACDGLAPLRGGDYPFIYEAVLDALKEEISPAGLATVNARPAAAADKDKLRLFQGLTRIRNELRYLEMHLLAHPMALLRPEADRYGCTAIRAAFDVEDHLGVRLAVTVAALRRVPTREGVMQFVTFEDETGLLEGVVPRRRSGCLVSRADTRGSPRLLSAEKQGCAGRGSAERRCRFRRGASNQLKKKQERRNKTKFLFL